MKISCTVNGATKHMTARCIVVIVLAKSSPLSSYCTFSVKAIFSKKFRTPMKLWLKSYEIQTLSIEWVLIFSVN